MISTSNTSTLPDRNKLQHICKSISVLDAILSQEWVDRYFSYQRQWSEEEEFFEMRNGQGDSLMILFRNEGCIINGMTHEYYPKDKSKLTKGLPEVFAEFVFGEPVNSIGTTFCLWTTDNFKWQTGQIENLADGSSELLWIFDNEPQTYFNWAKDYYQDHFLSDAKSATVISDIYSQKVLTREMVLSIVNVLDDWGQLKNNLDEIGYSNII
jgi:hypothetical protein